VQAAYDGIPDETASPLTEDVIRPLYGAFAALDRARQKRGTLDLEIPERHIQFGEDGQVHAITVRERLDSHRLIEEFMIAANVAAAQTLEEKSAPVMYRIHEPPAAEKIEALGEALDGLGLKLAKSGRLTSSLFAGILKQATEKEIAPLVSEIILRSQSQAVYGPARLGHFGLALSTYCHFTSPIRRYADILVHRALISALGLGKDGLSPDKAKSFEPIGEEISTAERRAMTVEREVRERLVAGFIANRVGATFEGRITGITRHGLFVRLNDTGAEGLLPIRTLPDDWYEVDETGFSMTGERFGLQFRLGEALSVELADASPTTGSLTFRLVSGGTKAPAGRNRGRKSRRPRRRRR
ncbi:MAG TPA: ribonuclease R, partial [Rhodospirillaceae bacterium]|nr:ribonuclease R [Rhodospirillaceae bacterium]